MTKLREPVTIEEALSRSLGNLTPARAAAASGRSPSYLLEASDPDKPQQLNVTDMLKLDIEHLALDGTAPLFAMVGRLLELARAEIYVDAVQIGEAALTVFKEDGDSHVALFLAAQPDAPDDVLVTAILESDQSCEAHTHAVATMRRALDRRRQGREARPP